MNFVFQYVPYKTDDYKKPFFFAYTKASIFTLYFLVYILFKELRKPCGNQTNYMVILGLLTQFLIFYVNYYITMFQFVNFDTIENNDDDDDEEDDNVFTDETERLVRILVYIIF